MEISPISLFWLLVYSVLLGGVVGILNDLHRITRMLLGGAYASKRAEGLYERKLPFLKRPLKRPSEGRGKRILLPIVMAIQDVFLFCVAGVGCVVVNYYFNDGQFRYYTILAVTVGFLAYYFTLGRLLVRGAEYLLFYIRALFAVCLWLVCRPFAIFGGYFWKKSKNIYAKVKKTLAKKQKMVYNIDKSRSTLENASIGFLIEKNKTQEEI